ncbi:hypothetical protein TRICI_004390 [Trichomonascus ciferrii]|uniref:Sister chromatid cohesion protein DCC1 n=1 Tax=Trichomonascus ciferrii TaxID=44093 RepID=A0A642V161_9ASCO|nr:hypothetical protein TRICI_004390 [Trichomonascus ciferrii]
MELMVVDVRLDALLQLTPELQEALEAKKGERAPGLILKAPQTDAGLVVCTGNKTFKLRKMNQTNTVLTVKTHVKDSDDDVEMAEDGPYRRPLVAFGSVPYFLEPTEISGDIRYDRVPRYVGNGKVEVSDSMVKENVDSLRQRSAISDKEFYVSWYHNAGVEINGIACIISPSVLKTLLGELLAAVVAEGLEFKQLELHSVYKALNSGDTHDDDEPVDVVEAVLRRFCTIEDDYYRIDEEEVVNWLGIQTLREQAYTKAITMETFMKQWRDSIPISSDWTLDLTKLTGSYVCPDQKTIRYLTLDLLSNNPKQRFSQLFTFKPTWDLDEIFPFIDDLRSKTVKLESFVMKYARKKTINGKITVSSR